MFVDHHARRGVPGLHRQHTLADAEALDQCHERRRQIDELGFLARDDRNGQVVLCWSAERLNRGWHGHLFVSGSGLGTPTPED